MRIIGLPINRQLVFLGLMALALCLAAGPAPAKEAKTIVFADLSWDSVMVHNRIVGFIIDKGMGYKPDYVPGASVPLWTGMAKGDVHVNMESWTENVQDIYDKLTAEGKIIDLGPNFGNSWQGWLVPTYVIKGDPGRGIEPMAPELESISDMAKYWEIFKDPEDPGKGRFYNGIAGWKVTQHNTDRLKAYGLDKYYNDFIPGSDAALSASIAAAYKKGKPWFGYYWAPTWVLGLYDMTPLKEPAFDAEVWETTKKCALPSSKCNIIIWSGLPDLAPDVVALLKNHETTMEVNNKILAWMRENKGEAQDAARWYLKTYEADWTGWVSPEVAAKVKEALN